MPKNIVWTAVVSALAGAGSLVYAFLGQSDVVLSLGFIAVASALLSTRER